MVECYTCNLGSFFEMRVDQSCACIELCLHVLPPVKLAEWLEQTKLESGTALVPSKDAICHMIGDVVVFLCSLVLCLLTIFSVSVLFVLFMLVTESRMVLQIGSRLRDMKRDERDISFLLVQILARDHGCLASRIKQRLITPFSLIFLSPYV